MTDVRDPERARRWILILSPFGVIALCHAVQRILGAVLGVWAWLPTILVFWGSVAALIASAGRGNPMKTGCALPAGNGRGLPCRSRSG